MLTDTDVNTASGLFGLVDAELYILVFGISFDKETEVFIAVSGA